MTDRSDLYELRGAAKSAGEQKHVLTRALDELQYTVAAPVLLKLFEDHGPLSYFKAFEHVRRELPNHSQHEIVMSILRLVDEGRLHRLESGLIGLTPEEA